MVECIGIWSNTCSYRGNYFLCKKEVAVVSSIDFNGSILFFISVMAMPSILGVSEYRGFLLWAMILHFAIAIILTIIAYITVYILKRKQE